MSYVYNSIKYFQLLSSIVGVDKIKVNKNSKLSRKVFMKLMKLRAMESLVQPAEGVGLLAAQVSFTKF